MEADVSLQGTIEEWKQVIKGPDCKKGRLDTRAEAKIQTINLSADKREDLIKFYQDIYTNGEKVLLRANYKEMVEIALKLLGSE